MDYYEAKTQGKLAPLKRLAKVFPSIATILQPKRMQNRSKYNVDGSVQKDHTEEALEQRQVDFSNG